MKSLKVREKRFSQDSGGKNKREINFMQLIKRLSNQTFSQTIIKILKNGRKLIINSIHHKNAEETILIINDYGKLRSLDKAALEKQMMTLYFSSVAHDLRTPLNAMMASNERLKAEHRNNRRMDEVLLIQETSGKFLLSLIEDILDLSRM